MSSRAASGQSSNGNVVQATSHRCTSIREDETICLLEGAITAYVRGQKTEVEAESYAALPETVPHSLPVHGEEARLLITISGQTIIRVRP